MNTLIMKQDDDEFKIIPLNKYPKGISFKETDRLNKTISPDLLITYNDLISKNWNFYAVEAKRGRCYYETKIITIPIWAMNKGAEYMEWYVAHEMAHAICFNRKQFSANHGILFMRALIEICPSRSIHHEIGYKPRNAMAAGITAMAQSLRDNPANLQYNDVEI
jgi:hypothetical protein